MHCDDTSVVARFIAQVIGGELECMQEDGAAAVVSCGRSGRMSKAQSPWTASAGVHPKTRFGRRATAVTRPIYILPKRPYGIAPTGSIMRWMTDGWRTELTSRAAAKRSSNELSTSANSSKILMGPTFVVRLRKLQPSSFISLADASGASCADLLLTAASLRWRCSTGFLLVLPSFVGASLVCPS